MDGRHHPSRHRSRRKELEPDAHRAVGDHPDSHRKRHQSKKHDHEHGHSSLPKRVYDAAGGKLALPSDENEYVSNWLAGTEEVALVETTKRRHRSTDIEIDQNQWQKGSKNAYAVNEASDNITSGKRNRKRKREQDSSDSSLLKHRRARRNKSNHTGANIDEEEEIRNAKHGHAAKRPQIWQSDCKSSETSAECPRKTLQEPTYEKRSRYKTREDRYDPSAKKKKVQKRVEDDEVEKYLAKKKPKRPIKKSGGDVMRDFTSGHVAQDRLTMPPTTKLGLFNNGRVSSPSRRRGLPDLAFSEMRFLQSNEERFAPERASKKMSMSREKGKNRADAAQEEISSFFKPRAPSGRSDHRAARKRHHSSPTPYDVETQSATTRQRAWSPSLCLSRSARKRQSKHHDRAGSNSARIAKYGFQNRNITQKCMEPLTETSGAVTWSTSPPSMHDRYPHRHGEKGERTGWKTSRDTKALLNTKKPKEQADADGHIRKHVRDQSQSYTSQVPSANSRSDHIIGVPKSTTSAAKSLRLTPHKSEEKQRVSRPPSKRLDSQSTPFPPSSQVLGAMGHDDLVDQLLRHDEHDEQDPTIRRLGFPTFNSAPPKLTLKRERISQLARIPRPPTTVPIAKGQPDQHVREDEGTDVKHVRGIHERLDLSQAPSGIDGRAFVEPRSTIETFTPLYELPNTHSDHSLLCRPSLYDFQLRGAYHDMQDQNSGANGVPTDMVDRSGNDNAGPADVAAYYENLGHQLFEESMDRRQTDGHNYADRLYDATYVEPTHTPHNLRYDWEAVPKYAMSGAVVGTVLDIDDDVKNDPDGTVMDMYSQNVTTPIDQRRSVIGYRRTDLREPLRHFWRPQRYS